MDIKIKAKLPIGISDFKKIIKNEIKLYSLLKKANLKRVSKLSLFNIDFYKEMLYYLINKKLCLIF